MNIHIVTHPFAFKILEQKYPKQFEYCSYRDLLSSKDQEFLGKIQSIICTLNEPFTGETVQVFPNLRGLSTISAGFDHIDVETLKKKGIRIFHTPGVLTAATVEIALLLTLLCTRDVKANQKRLLGTWKWDLDFGLGKELKGKNVLIFGEGRIGKRVGEVLNFLGCKIDFIRRYDTNNQAEKSKVKAQLESADILHLCVSYSKETHHWLDWEKIQNLKNCTLINTSRGKVVDESKLIEGIERGYLDSVGLDVFEFEPSVPVAFIDHPKIHCLPHLGSATFETREAMVLFAGKNILDMLESKKPLGEIL